MVKGKEPEYRSRKLNAELIIQICNILKRSIGLNGDNIGLLNCEHGIISLASHCEAILKSFQEEDVLKTFYNNMINSFIGPDLTGTTAFLSMNIFIKILKSVDIRPKDSATLDELLSTIKKIIASHSFNLSIKNTVHLKALCSGVITPKLSKFMTFPKQMILASLILESYISCIGSMHYPVIKVMKLPSSGSSDDSKFYHGILLPLDRTSCYKKFMKIRSNQGDRPLSIGILSCPMPQELESYEGETFKFVNEIDDNLEKILVKQSIKILGKKNKHLDILCSQKVIHQSIKAHLQGQGILVLDRLSIFYAENLATLSGCSLSASISEIEIGKIKNISLLKFDKKSYLHFIPTSDCHFGTIVLHNLTEYVAKTIEECIAQSVRVCNTAMATQLLVHGGPCLYYTILSSLPLEPQDPIIRCIRSVLHNLCRLLTDKEMVALGGHVWIIDQTPTEDLLLDCNCVCGSYKGIDLCQASLLSESASQLETGLNIGGGSILQVSEIKICHPSDTVTSMFDKTFQILDVLFKSELK